MGSRGTSDIGSTVPVGKLFTWHIRSTRKTAGIRIQGDVCKASSKKILEFAYDATHFARR